MTDYELGEKRVFRTACRLIAVTLFVWVIVSLAILTQKGFKNDPQQVSARTR